MQTKLSTENRKTNGVGSAPTLSFCVWTSRVSFSIAEIIALQNEEFDADSRAYKENSRRNTI